MDLNELYRRLALGELSNTAMVENGNILEDKQATIVLHANDGLKRLHTRFHLKEDTLFIDQVAGRSSYPLESKYALSNTDVSNTAPRFINDIGRPFTNDLVKVLGVYNGFGEQLPLNDQNDTESVFTPQPLLLQVPRSLAGAPLALHYQAYHPVLSEETPGQLVDLPEFLMKGLTGYIASQVFGNINTQESNAKARDHDNTYESICIEAEQLDLVSEGKTTSGIRFEKNGWI